MITCPNFGNPEVVRDFNEIKNATSELAAYHIWSLNNGNAIDRAPNGAPSKLFLTLLEHYNGDRTKAIQAKAKTYGKSFLNWFGDWINDPINASKVIDDNGEPLIVYHGSEEKFTEFDINSKNRGNLTSILKKGFYFSNKNIASQYASSKARNDYFKLQELEEGGFSFEEIAEAFGANRYDDDSMDRVAEYIMSLEDRNIDFHDNLYAVFLNIKHPVKYDLKGKTISSLSKSQRETINNSEGAIINNVDETTARYRGEITIPGMYIGTDYIVFEPNQIKSATDNNGYFSTENDDIQMMVVGEIGARSLDAAEEVTTRMDNLSVANEMEKAGKDALTIKMATGWERGVDGKWRYETNDIKYKSREITGRLIKASHNTDSVQEPVRCKLSDILSDSKNQPEDTIYNIISSNPILRELNLEFSSNKYINGADMMYNPRTNTIYIGNFFLGDLEAKNTWYATLFAKELTHELQHVLQTSEGFEFGTSVGGPVSILQYDKKLKQAREYVKKQIELKNTNNVDYEALLTDLNSSDFDKKLKAISFVNYYRNAGEVEARTAANRRALSPEERRNSLFTDDMYKDVAKEDLIFLQEGIGNGVTESRKRGLRYNKNIKDAKKSITNQLINHLRSIGIKVRNRRDMIKYLREHGLAGLLKSIERKVRAGYGVTILTEALNITGNKFKNSLYRGQGYTPTIDAEGNLHLHTHYDSLSKLRTLSFDSTIEGAEHYGNRSARHPYIIEVDEDFLDTVVPKEDYDRNKVDRGESFRYDEEFNEVRLSFKDELIIPKGKFNITQTNETLRFENFNDIMANIGWLQSLEERSEIEEYNGASEITGRVHENDLKALSNALHNTLGTYKGYDIPTILYDVLALQNDTPGSPIAPSRQYKEFINKGLIEAEYQNGYTYYRPSKDIVKYLTKKLGLKEVSETSQPILYQNPHTLYSPYTSSAEFDLPFFLTPSGEVYGFVAPNDDIYLDETVISPEHPIHEYTHMWDRIVAEKNSTLWKKGVELMKQISLWEQIENNPNYGRRWKAMSDMTADKLEFLIASEVHSRLVGEDGSKLLDRIAKQKGKRGIIAKLKQWILDFWKDLKSTFSNWSESDIQKLTLEDFNRMTIRDFADGVNFDNTLSDELKSQLQKLGQQIMKLCE